MQSIGYRRDTWLNLLYYSKFVKRVKYNKFKKWVKQHDDIHDAFVLTEKSINIVCDECSCPARIWEFQNDLIIFFCSAQCQEENKIHYPKFSEKVKFSFYPTKYGILFLIALALGISVLVPGMFLPSIIL
jgi:hypothetical protein